MECYTGKQGLRHALRMMLKLKTENPQYVYSLHPMDKILLEEWNEENYHVLTSVWWTNTPMFYQVLNERYSFVPVILDKTDKIVEEAALEIELNGLFGKQLKEVVWYIHQGNAVAGVFLDFERENKPNIKQMVNDFNDTLESEGCNPDFMLKIRDLSVYMTKDSHKISLPLPSGFFYYLSAGKYPKDSNDAIRQYYTDFLLSLNPYLKKYDIEVGEISPESLITLDDRDKNEEPLISHVNGGENEAYESEHGSNKWLWYILGGIILIGLGLCLGLRLSNNTTPQPQVATEQEQTPTVESMVDTPLVEEVDTMGYEVGAAEEAEAVNEAVGEEDMGLYIDEPPTIQGAFKLSGKIDDKYDIQIWLTIEGNKIYGKYCYNSTLNRYGDTPSSYIQFRGQITYMDFFKIKASSNKSSDISIWEGEIKDNRLYAEKILDSGEVRYMEAYIEK